ncbi:hypothetical protein LOD99_8185 [Oopsacas minuta]|uniref:Uncharacterized protein n=1 Tax=Oopsacas minuta TaxID=111878 RepID=A0AAV7JJ26_9METZ|nr:hypothetical protein LOD99_8185 [Oopsacas minuta]
MVHDYDINQTADGVVRILNLEEDKRHSVYSLKSKVSHNFRKSKKSIESLDGEWWSASISWIPVKPKSTQSFPSVSGCDVESGIILVPNVERRKSIDDIQVGSKKIRSDRTGILTWIRQLAQLENISIICYVALLLYIVAVEQIGIYGIANIPLKMHKEESVPTLSNIVSPEKSTF